MKLNEYYEVVINHNADDDVTLTFRFNTEIELKRWCKGINTSKVSGGIALNEYISLVIYHVIVNLETSSISTSFGKVTLNKEVYTKNIV